MNVPKREQKGRGDVLNSTVIGIKCFSNLHRTALGNDDVPRVSGFARCLRSDDKSRDINGFCPYPPILIISISRLIYIRET